MKKYCYLGIIFLFKYTLDWLQSYPQSDIAPLSCIKILLCEWDKGGQESLVTGLAH